MKNLKKWMLGFLSTCFLAVGLVRAADLFDPVNRQLGVVQSGTVTASRDCATMCAVADQRPVTPAPDCATMCAIASDGN